MPTFYENHKTRIIIYILMALLLWGQWFSIYRTKSMNSLFGLAMERAKSMAISNGEDAYGRTTDEKLLHEMIESLKPLKVKRIEEDKVDPALKNLEEENKFHITLYGNKRAKESLGSITLYKNNEYIIGDGPYYYKVVKGKTPLKLTEKSWKNLEEKYGYD